MDEETEFTALELAGSLPLEICRKCVGAGGLLHRPTQTAIVYCRHKSCGAYRALGRPWKVVPNIKIQDFRAAVLRALVSGQLRVEVARDLARILEDESKGATKH